MGSIKTSRSTFSILAIGWTIICLSLATVQYFQSYKAIYENARTAAMHSYAKDLTFRRWAASHGGVYVPVSPTTPPSPYLAHIPERDITTPSGKALTLLNPAYMTRQVYEMADNSFGVQGHITSLRPIRPENSPDQWETKALLAFEMGQKEMTELVQQGDAKYLRFMSPMRVEEGCLKCHMAQGYRENDIRGGISVSVPWAPYEEALRTSLPLYLGGYGGLWILGLCGIEFSRRRFLSYMSDREKSLSTLTQNEELLRAITSSIHEAIVMMDHEGKVSYWNPAAEQIFGYNRSLAIGQALQHLVVPVRYHEKFKAAFRLFEQSKELQDLGRPINLEAKCSDGKEIPVAVSLSTIKINDKWSAVGIVRANT